MLLPLPRPASGVSFHPLPRQPSRDHGYQRAASTMLTDMETCYKVMRTDVLRSFALQSGFWHRAKATAKIFKRRVPHMRIDHVRRPRIR